MNKFFVFDLDGTLINTAKGIAKAVNNTLEYFDYKYQYSENEVIGFLGHGARFLYQKATKKEEINEEEYNYFQVEYVKQQYISNVYPEVKETLQQLYHSGCKLIVFSNKPNGALQFLMKDKLGDIKWSAIQGNIPEYPTKPDPTLINKVLHDLNLDPKDGYYVGDSYVDIETGKNAKLTTVIETYGYGNYDEIDNYHPDYKIKEFKELLKLI